MSKFKGIFDQADGQESDAPESAAATPEVLHRMTVVSPQASGLPGRALGKRSDPDYTQVSAYVGRETYRSVKIALVSDDQRDFSELVDELLRGWLTARG